MEDPWPRTEAEFDSDFQKGLWCLLAPERLLDILAHFIVFERNRETREVVKKVCRYQQYWAANKIVERVIEGKHRRGLAGADRPHPARRSDLADVRGLWCPQPEADQAIIEACLRERDAVRASLLQSSGMHGLPVQPNAGSRSTSTGFYNFGTRFREVYPDAITLPQHFINNGYVAHSMGKVFHIGHGNTNDDASWSVPHHPDKVIDYVLPESNHRELTREEGLFTNQASRDENGVLRPRGAAWEAADVLDEAYADGRVAATAVDRLR